ncbi:hypothetical protein [Gymnodinialimonas ulvae]|uniref:hypothetical protein n=1 Tax=Gymnodinialimonas ulvae TaxID=3126504 RepID=UPI00309EEAAE
MNDLDKMMGIIAELIINAEENDHQEPLQRFDDFAVALSQDSGFSVKKVQCILVAKMLEISSCSKGVANNANAGSKVPRLAG